MASHRRPKQPSRTRVTVLTATAAAAVALSSQAAHADPKPSKSEVKAKVDKLYHEAEAATEKYNGAKEQQDKLKKQVDALQDKVARGQDELNSLRGELGSIATAQYRSGGIDPSVALFLASDPDSFLDQASALDQLTVKQTESLQKIQSKQRTLAQQRQEAQDKLGDLADVRKALGENKKKYQGKLADAQRLLNSLTQAERAKIQQEENRASRASSERVELGNEAPASNRGAAALSAAATQLGKPYVSGGSGPNSYDCSGLTQWAFAQAGVNISRTTYTQQNDGVKIGRSQLKPGDLVFFNGLSHVGFYAGNNQILHAPKPGTVVRYESMDYMGTFQFGVRI
ncbi:NlpC/P60 family protein [Streptomyces microflavus]|uniref:C40 family peptidase n=2 Tax=Streptomyces microflavus TaxID=1919 RepID=A0A6N9VEV0_STRMI|nr:MULTISPECIES: NlpC/P60 family protein [Streptomyces]MBK3582382.1 C40 family peptidase [Streptomyces sp. MBT57]AGK76678.1 NLP/P60-family protein [Streptomyces microflavus DSM 40593]MBK5993799.1 C40 family peptidase [Streptomyces sp. MBT58]MBW3358176.1 C40 family peptidase [Streptomyces sp. 09ZI22]MCX4651853.1 NlpC/P60 family protein [Streptomyces microflavus]